MKNGRRPSKIQLLLANMVILLVAVVILDACLSGRLDLRPSVEYDAELQITVNLPNLNQTSQAQCYNAKGDLETYRYPTFTDAEGCRVGVAAPPPSSTEGVALVGDSFSFGYNASYEESLAGQLGASLKSTSVYDFGVPGTCSAEYARLLRHYAARKGHPKFRAVVVGLYVDGVCGDIPRLLARQTYGGYRTFAGYSVSPSNYQRLSDSSWARFKFHGEVLLRRYSAIYNRLSPPHPEPDFASPLPAQIPEDLGSSVLGQVITNMEAVRQESGLPPQQIVVFFIPSAGETFKIWRKGGPGHTQLLWDSLKKVLLSRGYRVVDPRGLFVEQVQKGEPWPFTTDSHLTPLGFKWLSQPVIKEVKQVLAQ